jgi:hypothetical protein
MLGRFLFVIIATGFVVSACDKGGGRPAPNSVPVAQPLPAQNPQASPAATAVPGSQTSQKPVPSKDQPQNPPKGSPPNPSTIASKPIFLDNSGSIEDQKISGKAFLLANFAPKHMQPEVSTQQDGKELTVRGIELTYLSDESYISCSDPRCLNRIADESDYRRHTRDCWIPSLTQNIVSRLEFKFEHNGTLTFLATINENGQGQMVYGAQNIGYKFDGFRLEIKSFIATTSIINGENRSIQISGYAAGTGDNTGNLKLERGKTYDQSGYVTKVTPVISFGTIKDGHFVAGQSGRVYVGGVTACLTPTDAINFGRYKY